MNDRVSWHYTASRSLEVRFDDEVPKEIHAIIKPIIEQEMWLLPTWVQLLFVRYTQPNRDNISMSTTISEEYRSGTLYIHPTFLIGNEVERIAEVRHEFIHWPLDVLANVIQQMIDMEPDEKVKKILERDLRIAVEKAVVDLEQAITRRFDESGEAIVKRGPVEQSDRP